MSWMKIDGSDIMPISGFGKRMLSDERTTHEELPAPREVERLVVARGGGVMRALVGFLRGEGINVRTVADAEGAFEEALLHPPDVVLIDDRVPPSGGIDLVLRLKANVRTHFVPTILCALNDLRRERVRALAAGVDAVFAPNTDVEERRARVWALLRTRALYARSDSLHTPHTTPSVGSSARSETRSSTADSGCLTSCTTSRDKSARCRRTSSTWIGSRRTHPT